MNIRLGKDAPRWIKKQPIHLMSSRQTITPCGRNIQHSVIKASTSKRMVTCKLCKKTNWYKNIMSTTKDEA